MLKSQVLLPASNSFLAIAGGAGRVAAAAIAGLARAATAWLTVAKKVGLKA